MGRKFLNKGDLVILIFCVPAFIILMASFRHEISDIIVLLCGVIIALCCICTMAILIRGMFEEIEEEEQKKRDLEEMNLERQAEEFEEEERQRRIQEFAKWNESFNDL